MSFYFRPLALSALVCSLLLLNCSASLSEGTLQVNKAEIGQIVGHITDLDGTLLLRLTGVANKNTVDLTLTESGPFNLEASGFTYGEAFDIEIAQQPQGQECTLESTSGVLAKSTQISDILSSEIEMTDIESLASEVEVTAEIEPSSINITCLIRADYAVQLDVQGLVGTVSLNLNDESELSVASDGKYEFPLRLEPDANYEVSVATHPENQYCSVSEGSGAINGADISNILVTCASALLEVSGTVSGNEGDVVIRLGESDKTLTIDSSSGTFNLGKVLAAGLEYRLTVDSSPEGQRCSVNQSEETAESTVIDTAIVCVDIDLTVSGDVSGLNGTLVLSLNSSESLSLDSSGGFTFPETLLASGDSYEVTITSFPDRQICNLNDNSGTLTDDVTNVSVSCSTPAWSLGGAISGLSAGGLVLANSLGDDLSVDSGSSSFTFPYSVYNSDDYSVSISSQPTGLTCSISDASGTISGASVSDIALTCSTSSYNLSGTVSGLTLGRSLTLQVNGGDDETITSDGAFTFDSKLAHGASYTVTVSSSPALQVCTLTSASGTITSDVSDVGITCVRYIEMFKGVTRKGNFGGLSGANTYCSDSASKPSSCPAGVKAFLNFSTIDITDMPSLYDVPSDVKIQSADGTVIADNWADLTDGTIDNSLDDAGITSSHIWTGVDVNGDGDWTHNSNNCSDWASSGNSFIGRSTSTNSAWIDLGVGNCNDGAISLICLCY